MMQITQVTIGRFHHFHLARILQKAGLLNAIWTGYPQFQLKDEQGIPPKKIKTFPWVQTPYMIREKFGLGNWRWLNKEWEWLAQESLDRRVAASIESPTVLVALSASGLAAGRKAQRNGGHYVCDRCSTHIQYQNEALSEEYKKWGFQFNGVDPRIMAKEEAEYDQSDRIFVPSEFVRQSFIVKGVPGSKIEKVIYGARLERFKKVADPAPDKFTVLWVGRVSIRKGFMYLLKAFQNIKHPAKELIVAGIMDPEIKQLLASQDTSGIQFIGQVKNSELPKLYSKAHVFVLPSVEEGLAYVQGEALACGCPVIATPNAGAEDLFSDGKEGFIIPVGSVESLTQKLETLAQDESLRLRLSEAAIERVKSIGGWNEYGNQFMKAVSGLTKKTNPVAVHSEW